MQTLGLVVVGVFVVLVLVAAVLHRIVPRLAIGMRLVARVLVEFMLVVIAGWTIVLALEDPDPVRVGFAVVFVFIGLGACFDAAILLWALVATARNEQEGEANPGA